MPCLTTASGKTMRHESVKAKVFPNQGVCLSSSFCLFSVWLHRTTSYLAQKYMVSFSHRYRYTLHVGKVNRKSCAEPCSRTLLKCAFDIQDDQRSVSIYSLSWNIQKFYGLLNDPQLVDPAKRADIRDFQKRLGIVTIRDTNYEEPLPETTGTEKTMRSESPFPPKPSWLEPGQDFLYKNWKGCWDGLAGKSICLMVWVQSPGHAW